MRTVRLPTVCVVAATRCQLPGGMVPGGYSPRDVRSQVEVRSWGYGPRVGTVPGGYSPRVHGPGGMVCRAMMTKGMVFRYTWVYSKEDTMAHTRRPVVTS